MPVNGCTETYARPSLGAHYAGTTPVYPDSFHVYLDGRDYTPSATIQTGEMMFMPLFNLSQGSHNYRVDWVYGGSIVATDNVNFTVNSVIPGGGTYFQGQVAATTGEPLVNVRVLAAGQTAYTDVNGKFHFTNIPVGLTLFHFQTDAVTNPGSYTPVNLGFEILENQNTLWDRPVYLVKFDPSQGVMVQSNSPNPQTVTNPNLPGVQLVIPANTVVKFPDGGTNEVVTIINVPVDQAPNCLGPGFRPSRLISIQPENTTLSQPAQLTLPNDFSAPNGIHMHLMNLDVASGKFIITGTGTITNGSFVTDPNSGVATFDWFGAEPFEQNPSGRKNDNSKPKVIPHNLCSYTNPSEGALEEDHSTPPYNSLGAARSLTLHYNSRTAAPDSAVSTVMTPNPDTEFLSVGTLSVAASTPFGEGVSYFSLAGASSPYLASTRVDLSGATSGVIPVTYSYTTSVPIDTGSGPQIAGIESEEQSTTAVINGAQLYPALSLGWSYADVDRLVFESDGSVDLIGGAESSIEPYYPFGTSNLANGNLGFELGNLDGYSVETFDGPPPDGSVPGTKRKIQSVTPGESHAPLVGSPRFSPPATATAAVIQNLGSVLPTQGVHMAVLACPSGVGGAQAFLSLNVAYLQPGTERIAVDADVLTQVQVSNSSSLFSFGTTTNLPKRVTSTDNLATVLPGGDTGYAWRTGFRTYYIDVPQSSWGRPLGVLIGVGNENAPNTACAVLVDNIRFETSPQLPLPTGFFAYAGLPEDHTTFGYNPSTSQYVRVFKDGAKKIFDKQGREIQMVDRVGNTTTYAYVDGAGSGNANDLATVTDPVGLITTLAYNGGKLSTITDPASRVTSLTYNAQGRLSQITNPDGTTRGFTYDSAGRMTSQTDGLGQTRTYAYGSSGRIAQVTRADGAVYKYSPANVGGYPLGTTSFVGAAQSIALAASQGGSTYYETDPNGHITATVMNGNDNEIETIDALGQITNMAYDDQRNLVSLTLPNSCQYLFTYDALGNLLSKTASFNSAKSTFTYTPALSLLQTATDPLGRETSLSYDSSGNLTQVVDPAGGILKFTYNGAGQVTSRTDQRGNKTTFAYDSYGRLGTVADPLGHVTTSSYESAGNLAASIDPRGNTVSYQYDAAGKVVAATAADGGVTRYTYDSNKDLIKVVDPLGNSSSWTYNARRRPASFADALGNTAHYAYDGVDNLVLFTDAAGGSWRYGYDALDRKQTATDPFGKVTQWTYDAVGNVTAVVRPDGSIFASDYDLLSRLTASVAPDNATTSFTYDAADQRTKIQDPLGGVTQIGYDALGRVTSQTDPLVRKTQWAYDAASNLIQMTKPDSTVTAFAYDAANRRVQDTYADSGTVSYAYDANGNLASLTNAKGAARLFAYDAVNRPLSETDPLGHAKVRAYDLAGNVISVTRRDGAVITLAYDADNRLIQKGLPPVEGLPADQAAFAYDALSNMISASNSVSSVSNQFDAMSRLTQTSGTFGGNTQSLSFGYDTLSRRIQMTDAMGNSTYGYDNRDRLTNLTDASGNAFSFSYDALSRIAATSYPNGVTTTRTYDAASQLASIVHAAGATVANAAYAYNSVGNRISESREDGNTRSFTYDPVSRVTSANSTLAGVPNETFSYDKAGNPTNSGQQFDTADELISDASYTYGYDHEGNMTTRQSLSNPSDLTTFAYDAENRLSQVVVGPSGSPTSVVSYSYDPLGRRIARTSNGALTRYVLDGLQVRLELNGSNQVVASDTHASGIDNMLMRIGGPGATFFQADGLGSTIALTDGTGNSIERYRYSAFGTPTVLNSDFTQKAGNSPVQPFTYTGREWEPESSLYFYRARYLMPFVGRWLNADPAGLAGGTNLYSYTGDNPINGIDPVGLLTLIVTGTQLLGKQGAYFDQSFIDAVGNTFGEAAQVWDWSGEDNDLARREAGFKLALYLNEYKKDHPCEPINIVAHSHGGNVAFVASRYATIDNLVTLGTPVTTSYNPHLSNIGNYINVYSNSDNVQGWGGTQYSAGSDGQGQFGSADRTWPQEASVENVEVQSSHHDLHTAGVWNQVFR